MGEAFPKRKEHRLKMHDYSRAGAYFITICTADRKCILSTIESQSENGDVMNYVVGAPIGRPYHLRLTNIGQLVDDAIGKIPEIYRMVTVESYVIMPNHVHIILVIHADECGRPMGAPTIGEVINKMKGYVSKKAGFSIWQKLFYDHIIRSRRDYDDHLRYIRENPRRWHFDELYCEK